MALTLEHTPQAYTPAFNEVVFIAKTDDVSAGLSVTLQRSISFVSSEEIVTLDFQANADGEWVVDLTELVGTLVREKFVEHLANGDYGLGELGADALGWFFVDFAETGIGSPGTITSSKYILFNGSFYRRDFISYDHEEWVIGSDTSRFLTDQGKKNLYIDDDYLLSWMQKDDDGMVVLCDHLLVTAHDQDGSSATIELDCGSVDSLGSDISGFLRCYNVGAPSLNNASVDFITDTTAYWTVVARDDSNNETSETQTFCLKACQSKYANVKLYWLNRQSGMDNHSFDYKSVSTHEVERSIAKRSNTVFSSDFSGGIAIREEGRYVYNGRTKIGLRVATGLLRDYEMDRLMGLIEGSQVWLKDDANKWHSMIVKETIQEKKTTVNDKAFGLVVNLEYSYSNKIQR